MVVNKRAVWLMLLAFALVVAACGGDDEGDGGDGDGGSGGASGTIEISGSSTVEPISARVGAAFDAANSGVATSVEGPGTGDGFARFCNGETDISNASREIKDSEIESCEANGVEYVELQVATDGISVITSPNNDVVACLDFNDMYALVGPESEGFGNWSDANGLAAELGASNAPYPDAALDITAPGEESGTYDTFVELVIEDIAEERGAEEGTRVDYSAEANDQVIVNNISSNDTSFGWVGFAFFEENQESLKAIAVDGGDGCVVPTAETIASFEYPLSRPLFIYVRTDNLDSKPELVDFVDFYLSDDGLTAVSEAGYVQLPTADWDATKAAWEAAK
ncbi:MAG: phosphate ABC transporter substrate-binding protein PstS family protein [Acidimicrobiia bacterium]|nr:phosphate ABC transporter substrate-binding protein PstS family protein [Acidimicrobiia bacterium]